MDGRLRCAARVARPNGVRGGAAARQATMAAPASETPEAMAPPMRTRLRSWAVARSRSSRRSRSRGPRSPASGKGQHDGRSLLPARALGHGSESGRQRLLEAERGVEALEMVGQQPRRAALGGVQHVELGRDGDRRAIVDGQQGLEIDVDLERVIGLARAPAEGHEASPRPSVPWATARSARWMRTRTAPSIVPGWAAISAVDISSTKRSTSARRRSSAAGRWPATRAPSRRVRPRPRPDPRPRPRPRPARAATRGGDGGAGARWRWRCGRMEEPHPEGRALAVAALVEARQGRQRTQEDDSWSGPRHDGDRAAHRWRLTPGSRTSGRAVRTPADPDGPPPRPIDPRRTGPGARKPAPLLS